MYPRAISKIEGLSKVSIRVTEDELADYFEIPKRNLRDYHFELLFIENFKSYDDVLEFIKEFESVRNRNFNSSMQYFENLEKKCCSKLKWACSTLARLRRLCVGNYKFCCYAKP